MTKGMFSASALSLFLGCFGPSSLAQQAPATGKAAGEIAAAAKSFLAALDDGQRTLTPSHTGAQPATYELEAKTVRPLGRETDKALALVGSLDEAQRKQAVLDFQMHEPVLDTSRDGQTIQPEGIKVSALTEKQREMLLDLAGEWTGIMLDTIAKAKMDDLKRNVAETWFAWSGPTEKGSAAHYRIQPPSPFP